MSSTDQPPAKTPLKQSAVTAAPTAAFLQQRNVLVGEIAMAMDHVLQNINKLNRNLEGVIAVGNEFGAVEALWSQFENVMASEAGRGGEDVAKPTDGSGEEEEGGPEADHNTKKNEKEAER